MGEIQIHRPVLKFVAVSSRYSDAIDTWCRQTMQEAWGPIALESPLFDFNETQFYAKTMGADLKKQLFAFEKLVDPAVMADTKIQSNAWESQFLQTHSLPEARPINIDPGYVTEAKLVLVTTKDRDHRIYLRDGIFAEITLHYSRGIWNASRWTYPDYQRADFQVFLSQCRDYLRKRYQTM